MVILTSEIINYKNIKILKEKTCKRFVYSIINTGFDKYMVFNRLSDIKSYIDKALNDV